MSWLLTGPGVRGSPFPAGPRLGGKGERETYTAPYLKGIFPEPSSAGRSGVNVFRLFGYAIEPQRTVSDGEFVDPEGGSLPIRASLRSALAKSLKVAEDSGLMTQVTLDLDRGADGHRSSLVRDAVLDLAFRRGSASERGALGLARQLSRAMDYRSRDCLFLCAAYREGDKRRVALWIFPQDESLPLLGRRLAGA